MNFLKTKIQDLTTSKRLGLVCASFQGKIVLNMRKIYLNRKCANFQEKKFIG